jgi:hypothetical protein
MSVTIVEMSAAVWAPRWTSVQSDTLELEGLRPSIGTVGDAYDNAAAPLRPREHPASGILRNCYGQHVGPSTGDAANIPAAWNPGRFTTPAA